MFFGITEVSRGGVMGTGPEERRIPMTAIHFDDAEERVGWYYY